MERAPTNVVPLPVRLLGRAVGSTDREFSPLDVTLLTTPPSPIHARLIQVICTLMFAILAALWFGRVDIYATGAARIQPPGRSKVLQPLDGGRVRAIHTANGAHVRKGDVLVELDPTETQADREINQRQLTALDAEIARREASIEVARQGHLRPLPVIAFDANVDAADQAREQDVFATDIADLAAKLDSSNAQIAEKQAQEQALRSSITQQELLVESLRKRKDMRQDLFARQLESQSNLLEATEALVREVKTLADQKGSLLTMAAAIDSVRSQKNSTVASFIAQNSQAREEAQRKRNDAAQGLVKSSVKVTNTLIVAPLSGTVEQLAVTTIGQVVTPGQQLMMVVPEGAGLELEVLIPDKDIAFVRREQTAVIKIDAFPFTRYGTVSGVVANVSRDAITDHEAQMLSDATASSLSQQDSALAAIPKTNDLVYSVRVRLDQTVLEVDGERIPLLAGMSATAEIKTGRRRLLEYFLAPLLEAGANAAHER